MSYFDIWFWSARGVWLNRENCVCREIYIWWKGVCAMEIGVAVAVVLVLGVAIYVSKKKEK